MQKLRWLATLMGITILGIAGFQGYWLKNNYEREKQNLEIKTNVDFRQTILHLQSSKLKIEKFDFQVDSFNVFNSTSGVTVKPLIKNRRQVIQPGNKKEPPITMINLLQDKMNQYRVDSGGRKAIIFSTNDTTMKIFHPDSLQKSKFRGTVRSITVSSGGDSILSPELLREMNITRVEQENTKDGKKVIINYGDRRNEIMTESIDSQGPGRRDIFIGNHLSRTGDENVNTERNFRGDPGKDAMVRFLYNVDSLSLKDSVTVVEIKNAYASRLKDEKMDLDFSVYKLDSTRAYSDAPNEVTIGFAKPATFKLSLDNQVSYILKQLALPILFSIFLVGITIATFILFYRNLVKQRRLAELKNEFISNITHELKTPIATVGVAIEALKNFNAIHDPERTKEYLDISQNELQRLSLLVDKVLKLSLFEKKEMELKKEQFDCKQLTEEIMNSMKLQFEKYHAKVKLHTEGGNFLIEADKLHITSVIYNLLDNALKYGKENPTIEVQLTSQPEFIRLSVIDNGIGIAPLYKAKIFDKFFRVPTGNTHNIKGYGLGLSYVAEVIKRHHGHVQVESTPGMGSTFTATVPYAVT